MSHRTGGKLNRRHGIQKRTRTSRETTCRIGGPEAMGIVMKSAVHDTPGNTDDECSR